MTTATVLLTLDEARDNLGATAIALVDTLVDCPPGRLARLFHAKGTTKGLTGDARQAVKNHRAAVRQVLASDHAWILDEQIEGALSYARCLSEPPVKSLAA